MSSPTEKPAAQIAVRLQPKARQNKIVGERNGVLLAQVTAPPIDNKANQALRKLIAKQAGVPQSKVTITHGAKGRDKQVRVEGIDAQALKRALIL